MNLWNAVNGARTWPQFRAGFVIWWRYWRRGIKAPSRAIYDISVQSGMELGPYEEITPPELRYEPTDPKGTE